MISTMSTTVPQLPGERPADARRQWITLTAALTLPFFGSYIYFFPLSGTLFAFVCYTLVKIFTLLFPLIDRLWLQKDPLQWGATSRADHLRSLVPGAISGLLIALTIFGVFAFTPLGNAISGYSGAIKSRVAGLGVLEWYIPFCCFLALLHSLIEEYYWRWYVFGRLRTVCPVWVAHMLAAIGFSLHHYVVLAGYFPAGLTVFLGTCVGIGGFIWSWQFQGTGSLLGAWLSHALADVAIFVIGYLLLFG